MERIINNMMRWFNVSMERLQHEKEIQTPIGQTLYWDYYCYVISHPINKWSAPTSILYGSDDNLCEFDDITDFVERFNCRLDILEKGEHYFHTNEQKSYFRKWLKEMILT